MVRRKFTTEELASKGISIVDDKMVVALNGKTQTLWKWAKEVGVERTTILHRIMVRGWTIERTMMVRPAKYFRHGLVKCAEYLVWVGMTRRCRSHRSDCYERYGKRGIAVCERWKDFPNFYADMGPRPSKYHTIERVNNNGDYCPENCMWLHRSLQARNRRTSVWIEFGGKKLILSEWSRLTGLPNTTLRQRMKRGWSTERLLTTPSPKTLAGVH